MSNIKRVYVLQSTAVRSEKLIDNGIKMKLLMDHTYILYIYSCATGFFVYPLNK